jgi:hypothetical protein
MIAFLDFNSNTKQKETLNQNFQLTEEQLLILFYLTEKFNLTVQQTMKVEFIVKRECRMVKQNRFREMKFLEFVMGAILFVLDRDGQDWHQVNEFIYLICNSQSSAYAISLSTYSFYRNYYNLWFGIEIPSEFDTCKATLKLKC